MQRQGFVDERLAEATLFKGLPNRTLCAVSALTTRIELAPGVVIAKEGRAGSQFVILLDGTVAVSACDRVVATRGAGDFLGEISLLGACAQTATVLTTTPATVAVVSKPDFWSMLGEVPSLVDVLRSTMLDRLGEIHDVQWSARVA
jgi:CRP/FNR family transcriptional regulator, cyclic AMP receptor protein